jgi:hypothetical protein
MTVSLNRQAGDPAGRGQARETGAYDYDLGFFGMRWASTIRDSREGLVWFMLFAELNQSSLL